MDSIKALIALLQELNVEGAVFYHLDHLAEQILRLDDIAEITQCLFDNGGLVLLVCPRLFINRYPSSFQKVDHILLCSVGKVVVEDHAQDVVLELIGLHVSAQGHLPLPIAYCKALSGELESSCPFVLSLLVFLGVLPDEINDPVYQGTLLQKRQGFSIRYRIFPASIVARKLIFRNNVRQQ